MLSASQKVVLVNLGAKIKRLTDEAFRLDDRLCELLKPWHEKSLAEYQECIAACPPGFVRSELRTAMYQKYGRVA